MKEARHLNVLAAAVHSAISVLNLLASGYNALRGHKRRAVFHLGVAVYEAHAVYQHTKEE